MFGGWMEWLRLLEAYSVLLLLISVETTWRNKHGSFQQKVCNKLKCKSILSRSIHPVFICSCSIEVTSWRKEKLFKLILFAGIEDIKRKLKIHKWFCSDVKSSDWSVLSACRFLWAAWMISLIIPINFLFNLNDFENLFSLTTPAQGS